MLFRLFTIVAVIALGVSTWILSNPATKPAVPGADKTAAPGYYLTNAILTDYDESGVPGTRIAAQRITQIGGGNEVEFSNVQVNYEAPNGQSWVMFADTAHVEPGGKVVDMNGNVRLQGVDSQHPGTAVIRTDTLSYDVARSIATTKSDIRLDYARDTLTARGLFVNLKERTVRLESNVNGRFFPK